jgi:hypothetical protein
MIIWLLCRTLRVTIRLILRRFIIRYVLYMIYLEMGARFGADAGFAGDE